MRTCAHRWCFNELPHMTGRAGRPRMYCSELCKGEEERMRENDRRRSHTSAQTLNRVRQAVLDEVPCPFIPCRCGRDYATLPL